MQAVRAVGFGPMVVPKMLIQIGFEPLAETPSKNIFGQKGYRRASIVSFWKFLYNKGGIWGLFIGWEPRVLEALTSTIVNEQAHKILGPLTGLRAADGEKIVIEPSEETPASFAKELALDVACNSIAVAASHPFFVISTRTIVQWVAGDGVFLSLTSAVRAINAEGGLAGFYEGVVPALLQEASYVISMSLLHKLLGRLLRPITETMPPEQVGLISFVSHNLALMVANPLFFPFSTIKALMAVNAPHLRRLRPLVPQFGTWSDAFHYLYKLNGFGARGLLRGSGIVRRFYAKPLIL